MTHATVVLSARDADDLARCEAIVARGLQTFVEVGQALIEIRDKRLYRASHATFEEYTRDRWALSGRRIYELMDSAEVTQLISCAMAQEINQETPLPANERQARPLTRLLPHPAAPAEDKASAAEEVRQTWT